MQLAIVRQTDRSIFRRYFHGIIDLKQIENASVQFTIKHRKGDGSWIWANEQLGVADGEVHVQASSLPDDLQLCFSKFTDVAKIEQCHRQVTDTRLWTLGFNVPAAGETSAFATTLVGVPTIVARWFALVRPWTPWLAPRHGKGVFRVEEDAMTCSLLRRDGIHLVLLAVSQNDVLTLFRDDDFGGITVKARNDREDPATATVIAAVGFSQEAAFAACMYHARDLVRRSSDSNSKRIEELGRKARDEPQAQWNRQWTDGLGYCTWNGIGQNLTEQKIFDALDALEKDNIKITSLIIDDNWQSLDNEGAYQDNRGMTEFEANHKGFPRGLGKAVTDFRDKHPSIQHVAVWHALLGYWGGISPDGALAKEYKTQVVRKEDLGRVPPGEMTVIAAPDAERFYADWYTFLLTNGIDSVKTDAQFFLDLIASPKDRRSLIRAYQDAWSLATLTNFHEKCISCMSLVPQLIFHTDLPRNRPTFTLRNSDDFFPDVPDSHPWHVWTNAYTALLTQHLKVLPDWDMFQTAGAASEYAAFHAAARCVSGGPIYITDEPGKHDLNLINQMTASSNQGETLVLRPSCVARTVASGVYTDYAEPRLLKVGSFHGHSDTGAGILGVFNVSRHALLDFVSLSDFRGVSESRRYVVRAHSTADVSQPMALADEMPLLSLQLEYKGWEILTCYPLERVPLPESSEGESEGVKRTTEVADVDVAPLGLLGKMSGAAALIGYEIEPRKGQRMAVSVRLKALGRLGTSCCLFFLLGRGWVAGAWLY